MSYYIVQFYICSCTILGEVLGPVSYLAVIYALLAQLVMYTGFALCLALRSGGKYTLSALGLHRD